jgi:hypothetical protein
LTCDRRETYGAALRYRSRWDEVRHRRLFVLRQQGTVRSTGVQGPAGRRRHGDTGGDGRGVCLGLRQSGPSARRDGRRVTGHNLVHRRWPCQQRSHAPHRRGQSRPLAEQTGNPDAQASLQVPVFLPGELGHRRLGIDSGNSVPCGCGHTDCLESFCGGRSIERRDGDPKHIPRARWQYYGRIMAEATYDEVVQTRAELVTFSGGVACQQEWLLGEIQNYLLSEMHVVDVPEVKLSAFGESAGTLGALALGRQLLNK